MTRVLICGAGKVGIATAAVLSCYSDFDVYLADNCFSCVDANDWLNQQARIRTIAIDVSQTDSLIEYCQTNEIDIIVSTLLADLNKTIIEAAIACEIHYVDCSPKVVTFDDALQNKLSATKRAFIPNCGLAPGWTGIIANHFMQQFEENICCQVQVGVIADEMTNSLSGSAKRFMLELTEQATIINQGQLTKVKPLSDVWPIQIEDRVFETTHAAHGHGHLLNLWQGKVSHLSYQTLLPQGMSDKVQFLIEALRLHEQPDSMRQLLASVFCRQPKDALWIRIDCNGKRQGQDKTERFEHVIQPYTVADYTFSALQIATAVGIAAIIDMVVNEPHLYTGFITQEVTDYHKWLDNRFTQLIIKKDNFNQQMDSETSLLNIT